MRMVEAGRPRLGAMLWRAGGLLQVLENDNWGTAARLGIANPTQLAQVVCTQLNLTNGIYRAPPLVPELAGLEFHHAYVVISIPAVLAGDAPVVLASNAVRVRLLP